MCAADLLQAVVLLLCPLLALAVAAIDQWRRWQRDAVWRADILILARACGRLMKNPMAVLSALALLASAAWLALVVMHGLAG